MAERSLEIQTDPILALVYEPSPSETISRVEIPMPGDGIFSRVEENSFKSEATASFKKQCGNIGCSAAVWLSTISTPKGQESKIIWSAGMRCVSQDCPLGGPGGGSAGDREPLVPNLPRSSLKEEASLPI